MTLGADALFKPTEGRTAMTIKSEMRHVEASSTCAEAQASEVNIGLGPNQLIWLRRNINSFKYAEERQLNLRLDRLRAAHIAGLI